MKSFSKTTIGLAIFIIMSASFMRQVRDVLVKNFSDEAVKLAFISVFCALSAIYIIFLFYRKLRIFKIALTILVFELAYFLMLWQPFFAEKVHILEYGLLGYLALKDLSGENKHFLKSIIYATFFVVLVGSLEEGFQAILPYRVFEVRDIATNVVSGGLGIIQFLIYRRVA